MPPACERDYICSLRGDAARGDAFRRPCLKGFRASVPGLLGPKTGVLREELTSH